MHLSFRNSSRKLFCIFVWAISLPRSRMTKRSHAYSTRALRRAAAPMAFKLPRVVSMMPLVHHLPEY